MQQSISSVKLTALLAVLLCLHATQAQKRLVILGSSTSACWGLTNPQQCYVSRLSNHYAATPTPVVIDNRAVAGWTIYKSMPLGYVPPPGRETPAGYYTINDAIAANPDAILINYPSNGYDVFPIAEIMSCFRLIKKTADEAGKRCYITTTQPRTSFDPVARQKLRVLRDSIMQAFGPFAIDFWSGLADPVSHAIAAPYQIPGDDVHLNGDGHQVFFQRVVERNMFGAAPPPVVKAGPDQKLPPNQATTLNGDQSTAAAGIKSFLWSKISGPASYEILTPNASGTWIRNMTSGLYVYRLTVTDFSGATAFDDVTVEVASPVVPPVANAGKDQVLPAGQATVLNGDQSSAPAGIKSYLWAKISGPSSFEMLTPNAAGTWIRNMTAGLYVYRLTVTDNNGAAASDDVTVEVTSPVVPPVANAGKDQVLPAGQATVLNGDQSTAAAGIKSYLWSKISGPPSYEILTPNASGTWIRNMTAGFYIYRLSITDNNGLVATDDVVVDVQATTPPAPAGPVAQAGLDQALPAGQATVLNGEKSTAAAGIKTYLWTKVSGPAPYEILTPQSYGTWIRHLVDGIYIFRLTVTDNNGVSAFDDVAITVGSGATPPAPPVANAGQDQTLTTGQDALLNGSASSAAAGIKTFGWAQLSGPSPVQLLTPNAPSTTVKNPVPGNYVFRLTVTDQNGTSATDDVALLVKSPPSPTGSGPVANAGPDQALPPGQATVLNGEKSSAPAGIKSYLWTVASGPSQYEILTPDQYGTWIRQLVEGTYIFRLTITDNYGVAASDDVMIKVGNPPPPGAGVPGPVARAGNDQVLPVGQATVINGDQSQAPAGIRAFKWTVASGPAQYEMLTPDAYATWIRNMVAGVYIYRLTITDNNGAQAYDDVRITVTTASAPPPSKAAYQKNRRTPSPGRTDTRRNMVSIVRLFPNPSSDQLTVMCERERDIVAVRILHPSGALVSQSLYRSTPGGNRRVLQVKRLPPGFFLIEIRKSDGSAEVLSFVKR